ncbi:hypothetical protein XFF6991_180040 [Xanthomonas phaseoli pv. phaseoli]|uniref:Uncharacterized protein n=1 Tax=Xanthomonas campestris pv. phaseoli TaxID=317013 RepID=A0A7Z7NFL5_XANCH|nr:hypothetical protein XFF6991_180040 [Xanthomonas phaseoli pv. phaseoli]
MTQLPRLDSACPKTAAWKSPSREFISTAFLYVSIHACLCILSLHPHLSKLAVKRGENGLSNWRFKHRHYITRNDFGIELSMVFKCRRRNVHLRAAHYP